MGLPLIGGLLGGSFSILKLGFSLALAVGVAGVGSCAIHKIASGGRAEAELDMVRGASAKNQETAREERRLRHRAEKTYRLSRAEVEKAKETLAAAQAKVMTLRAAARESGGAPAGECVPGCRLPENIRRILEGGK